VGALRTKLISIAAVASAALLLGCGDPDQYLRHAHSDGGPTLPATTGAAGATGSAGNSGTAGTAGTSGSAGAGAAGSVGTAGTTGTAGTGAAGTAGSTGTAGTTGGAGTTGAAGTGAATCPGCKVDVVYTCLGNGTDSRNFAVEAKNTGTSLVLFKELTLRYWYTADAAKEQWLDCDTAEKLTCNYIFKSTNQPPAPQPKFVAVTPPRTKANEYVEIAITQGAMDVGGTTGRIQLRLHNKDFSQIDQSQDYSADCGAVGQAHSSGKVTAYIRGVLVAGTEPQ
jgi:hypothetical protein